MTFSELKSFFDRTTLPERIETPWMKIDVKKAVSVNIYRVEQNVKNGKPNAIAKSSKENLAMIYELIKQQTK